MKRLLSLIIILGMVLALSSCAAKVEPERRPEFTQLKGICQLGVMECYYHNVAKCKEEKPAGFHPFWKGKHFWVEYSGIVRLGIDAGKVEILNIDENGVVTISIPDAKVLSCKVDSATLNADSFIVASDSASVSGETETYVVALAQEQLQQKALNDSALLLSAQTQAQTLIEEYVKSVGKGFGKEYVIEWVPVHGE